MSELDKFLAVDLSSTEFSEFQLDRIKRFALASQTLSYDVAIATSQGQVNHLYLAAMTAATDDEPRTASMGAAIALFEDLSAYSRKAKTITRLAFGLVLIVALCGIFLWTAVGAFPAAVAVGSIVVALLIGNFVYGSRQLGRMAETHNHLATEEIVFALNVIIADPEWQRDT